MFGLETINYELLLVIQWVVIFAINFVPVLAPPTWIVLSFFYVVREQNLLVLVIIGVTASTFGRYALARFSGYLTDKFASKEKKMEFDAIKNKLKGKAREKFVFTFLYALSPLPSSALFIALGATKTKLKEVLLGFLVGRLISYLVLIFIAGNILSSMETIISESTNIWTIGIEVIGIIAIILFFLTDWKKILNLGEKEDTKKRAVRSNGKKTENR